MKKTFTPEFKGKVALEALKGIRSLTEIAQTYEVHPNVIGQWKKLVIESIGVLFTDKRTKEARDTRQAQLLSISRASVYYQPIPVSSETRALIYRIDEIYTAHPFLGSPRISVLLRNEGRLVNHKKVERLMRMMGLAAIYPKPRATTPHPGHLVYPYLLRGIPITHPNHVWGTDITYIRLSEGFAYLAALIDWFSRYVIA